MAFPLRRELLCSERMNLYATECDRNNSDGRGHPPHTLCVFMESVWTMVWREIYFFVLILYIRCSLLPARMIGMISQHPLICEFMREWLSLITKSLIPSWDLTVVLDTLSQLLFEPLEGIDLQCVSLKTALFLPLTTTKQVSELHPLLVYPSFMQFASDGSKDTLRANPAFVPKIRDTTGANRSVELLVFWCLFLQHRKSYTVSRCTLWMFTCRRWNCYEWVISSSSLGLTITGETYFFVSGFLTGW